MTELNINDNATATQMAEAIFGDGVQVVNASTNGASNPNYTGDNDSSGIYTGGDAIAPGVTPGDTGVILSTGDLDFFTRPSATNTNQSGSTSSSSSGPNNNADFNALAGTNTFDAAFLDVDFIPTGDTMTIQFVFASEEFPEYSNTEFNDVVGVWVNGSVVPLAVNGATASAAVGDVNQVDNSNLYNDNTQDQFNTEMDGFTVTLSLTMAVNPGVVNSIRIGIADTSDNNYDSALLIAGDSIQTVLIAEDDTESIYPDGTRILDVLANDSSASNSVLTITHINGQAVTAGQSVTLPSGDVITLNADGTFTIDADNDADDFNFTYTIEDDNGITDVGLVNVDKIPCFTSGTMIETDRGPRLVESLLPDDLVLTKDNGLQPLRWIGRRMVPAAGNFAPIEIAANTFGSHAKLLVSPQHRVLIRDSLADLLFGEPEVLVAAKDLVNDKKVRRKEGGQVEYIHLLFDAHEVVFSDGLATESFLPGKQTSAMFEADIIKEICTIFPELDPETGDGYSDAARRMLKSYEGQLLAQHLAA
ncbi:Hint domain-containing protein [Nereida sp. MMG025]|uniref:Hint domain-containing protein n=1 Tax=Nereida sp. MMG025 TaxID=2909981 RepID=UPI001F4608FE|nr:Hint domain-containing protein [Nereida sp. MMG025]MCF6444744.1 choice-of-anchor L domain-containing protein [Nereida sp. MMG025]